MSYCIINLASVISTIRKGKKHIEEGGSYIKDEIVRKYFANHKDKDNYKRLEALKDTISVCRTGYYDADGSDKRGELKFINYLQEDNFEIMFAGNGNIYFSGEYNYVPYVAKMPLELFVLNLNTNCNTGSMTAYERKNVVDEIARCYFKETKALDKYATAISFSPEVILQQEGMPINGYDGKAIDCILRFCTISKFKAMAKKKKSELKTIKQ